MAATTDVRLIRHGQTQGYISDGALTPLGRWQAHRKGQDLAKSIKEGSTVRLLHAATARARETAVAVREGVLQALSRYGIGDVEVEEPQPAEAFDNFQVWCDGKEMDVTAGFQLYARILEEYERSGSGDRPGWIVEMDRFYKIETAGGDPITQWLHQPMHYFEPPINVVRRHWAGIVDQLRDAPPNLRLYVCGHSGPLRALASAAVGHDPGEPYNVEDVRIRVFPDLEHAIVTYRGRGVEIEIPTTVTPSWHR
jgi:broad specificity phosphatase PhoE